MDHPFPYARHAYAWLLYGNTSSISNMTSPTVRNDITRPLGMTSSTARLSAFRRLTSSTLRNDVITVRFRP